MVGHAAGMVNSFPGGGISYAIRSGRIAGDVASDALEENNLSKEFLSKYQKKWERTVDYKNIKNVPSITIFSVSFQGG